MSPLEIARDNVIQASLSLQASRMWADMNPDQPYASDEVEMKDEQLHTAIGLYYQAHRSEVEGAEGGE